MDKLPLLIPEDLNPTRDYLQGVAHAIGAFQRAFLHRHPRDWHYGLEVYMRGLSTQELAVGGSAKRVLLDLHANKVRLDEIAWPLEQYAGPEVLNNLRVWLESQGLKAGLKDPPFGGGSFDAGQAHMYAEALWWLDKRFKVIKASLNQGVTSPVLLYPHHFDLALNWFPWDDERQLNVGWSTGDDTIPEPYIYLTAYPEPTGFTELKLADGAYWQKSGFSGAILPYSALQASSNPDDLLRKLVDNVFSAGRDLLA